MHVQRSTLFLYEPLMFTETTNTAQNVSQHPVYLFRGLLSILHDLKKLGHVRHQKPDTRASVGHENTSTLLASRTSVRILRRVTLAAALVLLTFTRNARTLADGLDVDFVCLLVLQSHVFLLATSLCVFLHNHQRENHIKNSIKTLRNMVKSKARIELIKDTVRQFHNDSRCSVSALRPDKTA